MNLTFLKKLGSVLAQGIAVAVGIEPLIAPFMGAKGNAGVQTAVNDFTAIGQLVVSAEAFFQGPGSGAEKLAKATPLVENIVKTSELVAGHKIEQEALFVQGCSKITSGMADILNSLSEKTIQTSGGPLPPPQPASPSA